jgi:RNA 3'-terminal phosphate cyclase
MKRVITLKVAFNGRRAYAPVTETVKTALQRSVGIGSTVTVVKTTEGQGRPGTPAPQTAHQLVEAILGAVATGRAFDSTTAARVRVLAEQARRTLGAPTPAAAR